MPTCVLIVGAGEAGRMLAREIASSASDSYHVAGFLDDNRTLRGELVEARPVLGTCGELPVVVTQHRVEEVIIAVPSASREFNRRMVTLCRDAGVPFRIVPGMLEIIRGPVRLEQIRDMRPEDLLGRESVEFDEGAISRALAGRSVLVTGAGGSIGGEICRQIGRFDLQALYLLGRGENQIYEIEQEMRTLHPRLRTEALIADIRDGDELTRLFRRVSPDYVYHAAAHKHVHFMEAFPVEAVRNNVFGTLNVIEAARAAGVERVVMLSTDKAVKPCGVMGATKRFAEYLMMSYTASGGGRPRLIAVRFGNVLASRGSVVPMFIRQIRQGGPVTVSHEQATRFFMSLKEACLLVVQASLIGEGGEVFILRMGEPIRILEVARDLIALYGYKPGVDIEIQIVGLRPGEKLHEDLVAPGEEAVESEHALILRSRGKIPEGLNVGAALADLRRLADAGDADGIRSYLGTIIPDGRLGAGAGAPGGAAGEGPKR
jgi:FlaA1/EpsC-like NDP-sugar epimerase